MELNQFQGLALRTESQISGIKLNAGNLVSLLKVVIEVTEILDAVKKAVFYNKTAKLEGDLTARLHALATLIEALSWQNSGRGPVGAIMAEETIKNVDPRVFHGILGIITESGELASALLKSIENEDTPIDPVNIQEEMSDIAWYKAILHDSLNLDWGQGLENVINKLRIRYPEKYSDDAAANRDLESERAALEVGVESLVRADVVHIPDEEDRRYFLDKIEREKARGANTERLEAQLALLDDSMVIYRLSSPPRVKPLAENPVTIDDLISTQPMTPNTGEIFKLWDAPAGTNRGPMTYVPGMGFVRNEKIDDGVDTVQLDGGRRIFYIDLPEGISDEEIKDTLSNLIGRVRYIDGPDYSERDE